MGGDVGKPKAERAPRCRRAPPCGRTPEPREVPAFFSLVALTHETRQPSLTWR
jgi:hypothetical protein